MKNILKYKGYQAIIEYSVADKVFFGKVVDTKDMIIFEIEKLSEAEQIFKEVIDDYLEIRKENAEKWRHFELTT